MSVLRQDIVSAIKSRFAALTTGGGYHNTLTGKVFLFFGRTAEAETLIDVRDTTQRIEDLSGTKWNRTMSVSINITVVGGTSDELGRALIEDMYHAIGTDRTWGGLAIETVALGDSLDVEQEEKRVTGATVNIEILYRTGAWAET